MKWLLLPVALLGLGCGIELDELAESKPELKADVAVTFTDWDEIGPHIPESFRVNAGSEHNGSLTAFNSDRTMALHIIQATDLEPGEYELNETSAVQGPIRIQFDPEFDNKIICGFRLIDDGRCYHAAGGWVTVRSKWEFLFEDVVMRHTLAGYSTRRQALFT